jgi:hydroxymethylbilane synthase
MRDSCFSRLTHHVLRYLRFTHSGGSVALMAIASSSLSVDKGVSKRTLTLGTRPSQLARWQTDFVAAGLRAAWPGLRTKIEVYTTRGDRELGRPLPEIGGKGLFTAEIEAALRAGDIDLAVHSLKDLPIADSEGLTIGAVLERAEAHDVLISRHGLPLMELPPAPRIGTSSPRRAAQILAVRPDAQIVPIRGNVDTRLRKAATEDYDAVVLAAAGLTRLGLEEHITQQLSTDVMLPAPSQGALAVQCRADDKEVLNLLHPIHHQPTWAAVTAERAFLEGLGGGCAVPVAAYAACNGAKLQLDGLVASLDGRQVVRVGGDGSPEDAVHLGHRLAQEALTEGAREILEVVSWATG